MPAKVAGIYEKPATFILSGGEFEFKNDFTI